MSRSDNVVQAEKQLWRAKWIWGQGPESPRNEWRCFRKSFGAPIQIPESMILRLTADSRYVLYVNGKQVGRGPVRSWPFELAYDEYEIAHLLAPGEMNVIAVLVMHYGVPTFQYLRGRGGLIAQIEMSDQEHPILSTDDSWITAIHKGHDANSSRISCQLPFTEINDARAWDSEWTQSNYDASRWEHAVVIGSAGMEPWVKLVERDIPYLTEQTIYPVRVESLSAVKPVPWAAVFDFRNHLIPDSANHANNVQYSGYMATIIHVKHPASCTIGMVDNGRIYNTISVNGNWYDSEHFTGEIPQRFLTVNLQQGDNFILMNISGAPHGHGFHLGIDCKEPFEIVSPIDRLDFGGTNLDSAFSATSPFITLGPFDAIELIDHQETRPFQADHPDFVRAKELSSADQISHFMEWVKPIDPSFINLQDVFSACVWKLEAHPKPVPQSMQNTVIAGPNSATIPIYPGYDTELVIDFGQELSGYISFEVDAPSGRSSIGTASST